MPIRIASLIASATEIFAALGLESHLVAISHECDYPPALRSLPRVTRSHIRAGNSSREIDEQVRSLAASAAPLYELDVEQLAALRPDLIVTQAQCDVCAVRYADVLAAVASRAELRAAQVVALNPQSLADVLANVERLGAAAGAEAAATALGARLADRIERVRALTADIPPEHRPRVALVEWLEPLMLSGNWVPELVELAGGRHDLTQPGRHSPYVSWQDLADYDPQVVLLLPCGFDLERTLAEWQQLRTQPRWAALGAVAGGRAFAVDGNAYFNRSGPRLVDSLEILGHLLHPEGFAAPGQLIAGRTWRRLD